MSQTVRYPGKFLFYIHSLIGGGAERVWALLATEIARRGHEVAFAVHEVSERNRGFLSADIPVHVIPGGRWAQVKGLAAFIKRENPDIVLSAIGVSNLKCLLACAMAGRMRRSLISFHGFFPSEPELFNRISNHSCAVTTRMAGRAVAVSDALRNELVSTYKADPRRTLRIHNPVSLPDPAHAPDEAALGARQPIILFVGRMVADKDLPSLIAAFVKLKTPEAELHLVGDGPELDRLKALASDLGLEGRVFFHGFVANPDQHYRTARAFAITSVHESFGNVVVEALGHGLPVVATDAAGPAEILGHDRAIADGVGAVVPRGNVDAIAAALDEALAHPGDPAPRIAHAQNFTIERAADAYLATCQDILDEARYQSKN